MNWQDGFKLNEKNAEEMCSVTYYLAEGLRETIKSSAKISWIQVREHQNTQRDNHYMATFFKNLEDTVISVCDLLS